MLNKFQEMLVISEQKWSSEQNSIHKHHTVGQSSYGLFTVVNDMSFQDSTGITSVARKWVF